MEIDDYMLDSEEEAAIMEMEEKEREARMMMNAYFDEYFMLYFPRYLLKHGPMDILPMIGKEDIKKYLTNESVLEIQATAAKLAEEQRELESTIENYIHSEFFYEAVWKIIDGDSEEVSDSESRSKADLSRDTPN